MPLNDPPVLDPKTKEVWLGLRRPVSRSSAATTLVRALQTNLSGYTGYVDGAVGPATDFDSLETELEGHYADVQTVSDGDVGATVATLEDAMAWSTYSDSSTGAPSLAGYDAYRTFLQNNAVSAVDADLHIQLLKRRFTPSYTVHVDRGDITSWSAWEQYAIDAGMSSTRAADLRTLTESLFADFATFDSQALAADDPLSVILNAAGHDPTVGEQGLGIHIWETEGTTAHGKTATPGDVSLRYDGTFHGEKVDTVDDTDSEPVGSADVSYDTLSVGSATIYADETTTVSTTVSNNGSVAGSVTVPVVLDGAVAERDTRTLDAGATETVSWTLRPQILGLNVGNHTVKIGKAGPKTITIAPAFVPRRYR